MAALDRVMKNVFAKGIDTMPEDEAAEQIIGLASEELKTAKDTDRIKALASEVDGFWKRCKSARVPFERQWLKNLDMFQGRQYTYFDQTTNTMKALPNIATEPRLVVNVIEPMVRTELSMTGKTHPSFTVVPASSEDEDQMIAQAGEQFATWFYATDRFHSRTFRPANWWASIAGNGFIKSFYDPAEPDPAAADAKKSEARKAARAQQAQTDALDPNSLEGRFAASSPTATPSAPDSPVLGKIKTISVSPFHLYVPDLTVLDLQEQPYIIHAYPMNRQQAIATYRDGVDTDNWQPQAVSADTIVNATQLGVKGGNTAVPDSVIVVEAWIKPNVSKAMPTGGLVVMIGSEIVTLAEGGLPYDHGMFPFTHLSAIETGTFYRRSVIETIIPLQMDINRSFSQATKHRNHMLSQSFFYDEGSVNPQKITTKPGTWIPVALGSTRPTPVQMQELPNSFWTTLDKLSNLMDDITGQHDVSRATAPGADTAASALTVLQESDDNFQFDRINSQEQAIELTGQMILALAVQFYDEPRLLKIIGDDEQADIQQLRGADLDGGTDFRVEAGSMRPESMIAKKATITDWMDKGYIPVDVGLQELSQGGLARINRVIKIDQDQATRENLAMAAMDPAVAAKHQADAELLEDMDRSEQESIVDGTNPEIAEAAPGGMQGMGDEAAPFAGINDPGIGITPGQQADPMSDAGAADAVAGSGTVDPTTGPADMGADPTGVMLGEPAAPPVPVAAGFPINDFDNHQIHISVHERFMKSQRWEKLSPEVQRIFLTHRQAHVQALQGQQMMQQPTVGGGPASAGNSGYNGGQASAAPAPAPAA